MYRPRFGFDVILLCGCCLIYLSCSDPVASAHSTRFDFFVLDAGQGLAQAGLAENQAVLWDTGPLDAYPALDRWYHNNGRPFLNAVIISHMHRDHYGALSRIDTRFGFSGKIYVSGWCDTLMLRHSLHTYWKSRVRFITIHRGDTLDFLPDVKTLCIWPPESIAVSDKSYDEMCNHTSLCFRVSHGRTSFLITSDTDTAALRRLCKTDAYRLANECMIVPHHGSSSGYHPVFIGYVDPEYAVISCSDSNDYAHPYPEYLDLFWQMNTTLLTTYTNGTIHFFSNGAYLTCQ